MEASNKILITDSLFIAPEHEEALKKAGYQVERLDKVRATEDELCAALSDKIGYILGGIEEVTDRVINSAKGLRAISFTGSGYTEFIPGHNQATLNGIAISAAKGANAPAVAEFSLASILMMTRQIGRLATPGGKSFYVAPAFGDTTVGIIGYGAIGSRVARLCESVGLKVICHSRSSDQLLQDNRQNVALEELLSHSDVVSLHVNKHHGKWVLAADKIARLRDGAAIVNCAFADALDRNALAAHLADGRLTAFFDSSAYQADEILAFPAGAVTCTNSQTAFNTARSNRAVSDRVTASLINLLDEKADRDLVNPEYLKYRYR